MLLGLAKWSSLPIAHLLHLANRLVENALGHFGETSLLLHQVYAPIVGLSINEILNILDEVHVGKLVRELVDVRAETKADDRRGIVCENST